MRKTNSIYILCPADLITGGPEALHQLCFYMRKSKINAYIVYFDLNNYYRRQFEIPVPYKDYISDYLSLQDIVDLEENLVILPETHLCLLKLFKKIKVQIWWLSVDNNFIKRSIVDKIKFLFLYPLKIILNPKKYISEIKKQFRYYFFSKRYTFRNEDGRITHICASYYAFNYVSKRTKNNCNLLIEPISKMFLEFYEREEKQNYDRLNAVLYNPRKSSKYVEKFKKIYPDIEFVPLQNMNITQLIDHYNRYKIYLDFGPFPGAERMPKEAVLFGCCIITGKHGASNFYDDVLIPNNMKYNDDEYHDVHDTILKIFSNYDGYNKLYDNYRKRILELEDEFSSKIEEYFVKYIQ